MWYGLYRQRFLHGFYVFAAIGVFSCVGGGIATYLDGAALDAARIRTLAALLIAVPAIWLVLFGVLSLTWLKVSGTDVELYLWKRFLVKRCAVTDVLGIETGSFSAVVLHTRAGPMHLVGLHRADREALYDHIVDLQAEHPEGWAQRA